MTTVTISPRGEDRAARGHPWIYRSDVARVDAPAGETRPGAGRRAAGRSATRSSAIDPRSRCGCLTRSAEAPATRARGAQRHRRAIALPRVAADRRDRLPAGPRRSGPAAVADRRSLRRLPGDPDAVAGHRSPAAGDRRGARGAGAAGGHPGPQRSARPRSSKGSSRRSRSLHGDVPETHRGARRARCRYEVDPWRGQKTGLFLDQRENREAALRYARGRLLDAFSYNGGFALALAPRCDDGPRGRHLGGRRRADPRQRRAQRARRTSRRAR